MPLEIDIEHIAALARLDLTEEELERYRTQLPAILEAAARVGEVAAEDVPPTSHPVPRTNVLRPDEVRPTLTHEEALSTAPCVEADRFKVPRIVEGAE
jgi:aspartyl-tRNA(Asn)/glutamyl-tRNA(Gln) amidotransferase subunit C